MKEYYKLEKNNSPDLFKKNRNLNIWSKDHYFYFTNDTFQIIIKNNLAKKEVIHQHFLPPSIEEEVNLKKRLHSGPAGSLHEEIPLNLHSELELFFHLYPDFSLEYLGRGKEKIEKKRNKLKNIKNRDILHLDISNGKRDYQFKVHVNYHEKSSDQYKKRYHHIREWLLDKDSKVILSFGSGGLRMFAIPTLLKILDILEVRDSIDEIWGTSGGAIIGALYAAGIPPEKIENLGYDFYNDRFPHFFSKKSKLKTAIYLAGQGIKKSFGLLNSSSGLTEVYQTFIDAYAQYIAQRNNSLKEIPFFSLATNIKSEKIFALSEEKNIKEYMKEMILPADPVKAISISSSIPFIFPVESIEKSDEKVWVDGMFAEEIPLAMPVIKYHLEKTHEENYPFSKIKIFYVDLGVRFDEMSFMRFSEKKHKILGKLTLFGKIFDRLLNSRNSLPKELLSYVPNIEIEGITLKIGKMAFLDPSQIPFIIQKSKDHFLDELDKLEHKLAEKSKKKKKKN